MPESGDDQFDDDELQVHLAEIHALNRKIALVREEKEKQQLHQNSISIDKEVSLSDYTSFDQGHSKLSPCPPGFLKDNRVLKGHTDKVQAMCWSTDNRRLVSVAEDGKLIIWNAFSALKTHLVHLSSSWSLTCAYSPNGTLYYMHL